jgi:hypothetical protein
MKCLLLLLLLISGLVFTAGAQKRLKTDVDKTTGDTTYSTSEERLYSKSGSTRSASEILKSTAYRTGDYIRLSFYIKTGRTSIFTIPSGSPAEITLADGNRVSFYTRTENQSRTLSSEYGSFAYVFFRINPAELRMLQNADVVSIRIQSSVGWMIYDLKSKQGDVLRKQLIRVTNTSEE